MELLTRIRFRPCVVALSPFPRISSETRDANARNMTAITGSTHASGTPLWNRHSVVSSQQQVRARKGPFTTHELKWTAVLNTCILMGAFIAHTILLSTNCPSYAAANQVVTLTRLTNERVVQLGRLVAGQFILVHLLWTSLKWSGSRQPCTEDPCYIKPSCRCGGSYDRLLCSCR